VVQQTVLRYFGFAPWVPAATIAIQGIVLLIVAWHVLKAWKAGISREHMPERVGIPGFRRGRRYLAVSGAPEFFILYEADSAEVLGGLDYRNRLNTPTAWTKRILPSMRNMTRSICRVMFTGGVGSGGVMLTSHFDIDGAQHQLGLRLHAVFRIEPARSLAAVGEHQAAAAGCACLQNQAEPLPQTPHPSPASKAGPPGPFHRIQPLTIPQLERGRNGVAAAW
jgi:hypothetical protein